MVDHCHHHIMPNQRMVAYVNTALILEMASGDDEYLLSDVNISAEVRMKRRKHVKCIVNFRPHNLRHNHPNLLRSLIAVIQFHRFLQRLLTGIQNAQIHFLGHFFSMTGIQIIQHSIQHKSHLHFMDTITKNTQKATHRIWKMRFFT